MRHDLFLNGMAFRLRPIVDADASFVLKLRCNPELNCFLHETSNSIQDQLSWFASYYERCGDYYFVIERIETSEPEGVVSIYNVDLTTNSGEWGRWILRHGSLGAIESAWLIYRCAFEQLGLSQVCCRTVAANKAVVSFHDSCGIKTKKLVPDHFERNGHPVDAIEHQVILSEWLDINTRLVKLAQMMARRLQRG